MNGQQPPGGSASSTPVGWMPTRPPEPLRSGTLESAAPGVRALTRLHEAGMACVRGAHEGGLSDAVLLDTALQLVLEVTGGEMGTVHVREPHMRGFRRVASRGTTPELLQILESDGRLQEVCHHVLDSRTRLAIEVSSSDSVADDARQAFGRRGIAAIEIAPVWCGHAEPAGVLAMCCQAPGLTGSQLRLVDLLLGETGDFLELARSRQESDARLASEREGRRRAEEASRSKDRFLATLSHEMRQPLSAILPALALYQRTTAADRRQRAADVIAHQMRQLRRMVEDLADTSAVSRGVPPLRREDVSLRAILQQVLESMQPVFEQKQHDVTAEIGAAPASISADPARIHQVFANLLQNAAAYTPPGGRIRVTLVQDGPMVRVHVRDSGVGIPPEALERVFDMFERGSQRNGSLSLGIGLALVRQIVELHGGRIEVSSEPGQGSEFQVVLPRIGDR